MTPQELLAAMRERIAKARLDRDIWCASGPEEKYLEAYFLVDALELQLERLRRLATLQTN
jgi:hypothetical protein